MNFEITNKDAKIIYSKYWYKNINSEMFPTIYIDEYWDYTIDLFNLRDDWETFLNTFNEEFDSAKQYIEESNKIVGTLIDKLFVPDVTQKINSYIPNENTFPQKRVYDLPDGEYWKIDLHKAFNQCLKYIGVFKDGLEYDDAINDLTKSTLLKKSKTLRFQMYDSLHLYNLYNLYNICDTLLHTVIKSSKLNKKIKVKDVIGISGDCIYISKNEIDLNEGDFVFNKISVNIDSCTIKSVLYKGMTIKYMDKNSITYFYKGTNSILSLDEYLCVMKTIKNQQPNQIDLTVGYEDQVFYTLD